MLMYQYKLAVANVVPAVDKSIKAVSRLLGGCDYNMMRGIRARSSSRAVF